MKALITGGYGFIGSHVAERFDKEGYEVHIIDNLSSGDKRNVTFRHKGYVMSVEDRQCEEIFRSNPFDAVVHLAAQVDVAASIDNPRLDSETNVLGLVNMLNLAAKYKVKKFISASSAAVYGSNGKLPLGETDSLDPISPYGIGKLVGESYVAKWKELYGLDTLCFRFSNVYGPRQGSAGEGGVVSVFINRLLNGQPLHVNGDGEQTRDFIYVTDVADAIFRASCSRLSGVYNLSTNSPCSVNALVGMLRELHGTAEIVNREERPGDIKHSSLDNAKVMRELDWTPLYDLKEGVRRTYAWFRNGRLEAGRSAKREVSRPMPWHGWKRALPYAENLLAFGLTAWFSLSGWDASYSFIDIKLFYITIMGILYGSRQSIIAVALSVGLLAYGKLNEGRELISLLNDTDFYFHVAVYLLIGLVIGYAIERRNGRIRSQKETIGDLERKYAFLNEVYADVREVKDELYRRIMNSEDSFGKIYSVTKELESLEPEHIFTGTVGVVETIMSVREVSIYTVGASRGYLRLVAHSGGRGDAANSIKVEESGYIGQMLADGKPFVNRRLTAGAPLMAAPVTSNGEPVAVIAIDGVPFEKFSLYYENLFKVTVDLVSSALSRALAYIEATESRRYVEGTAILNKEVFGMLLESKRQAKEKHNIDYLLLAGDPGAESATQLSGKLSGMLRETDYIGMGEEGRLFVLLSNTGMKDASRVMKRFAERRIDLRIVEEEAAYG